MKAAILTRINHDITVDNIDIININIGQVLVKILISGICGAQLQEIAGEKNNEKFLPHLIGHEGCGIVEEVGPGVTKVKKGDKVIMHWRKGAGIESPFPLYQYKDRVITSGKVTTLSEYSVVSENRLTPVDKDTPDTLCALLGCGLSTALGVINYDADIKFGEKLLILGCGGIGINLLLGARLANCSEVYILDKECSKQSIAELHGGTFITSLSDIKGRVDCIIDTIGNMSLLTQSIPLLSEYGRAILVCQPKKDMPLSFLNPINFFAGEGQYIKSTQGGSVNPDRDFKRYVDLYNKGMISIENIITHNISLDDINAGINILKSGKAGRIMVNMR